MSNVSESQIILPNPFTPMAFLSPELAFHTTIKTYVAVGITAVLVWDILSHLSDDYRLLTRYRIRLPTVTYFVSRVSMLLYIIGCDVFYTSPVHSCIKMGRFLTWSFPIAQSSTSLLFVLRVCAIYRSNRYIVAFFSIGWLAVVGSTLMVGLHAEADNIGNTSYCKYADTDTTSYAGAPFVTPVVLDTLVFVAITWRLVRNKLADYNLGQGVRMVVFGDYQPIFSKSLLQDGQMYYLTTLTTSLGTVVLYYLPLPFPPSYKVLLALPNMMLMNVMACRVYRNTKFGSCDYDAGSRPTGQLRFNKTTGKSSDPVIPLHLTEEPRRRRETEAEKSSGSCVAVPEESVTDAGDVLPSEKV